MLEKHALNREFSWRELAGPFRSISSEQADQFNRDGYLLLEDVFDADRIKGLLAEIDPLEAEFEKFLRDHLGGQAFITRADEITFNVHLVTRSPAARALTLDPVFRDLVSDLIGPDVRLYWDQSVYKKPGTAKPFPWHQDNGYTFVEPQQYLTCWIALTDADEENGCPVVAPGLHRQGTLAHHITELGFECFSDPPVPAVVAPVRAGSMLIFSSLTPHMTGPNLSRDRDRKAYIVQFAAADATVTQGAGAQQERVPCDAAERQYPVLVAGAEPD